jgi:hypothetical protein
MISGANIARITPRICMAVLRMLPRLEIMLYRIYMMVTVKIAYIEYFR